MPTELEIAWFSGLFEGEGSFYFVHDVPKGLQITMTDEDILLRVKSLFGGNISRSTRRNIPDHWKDAWRWSLALGPSMDLVPKMLPMLGKRRTARAEEMLDLGKAIAEARLKKIDDISQKKLEIINLCNSGKYTHQEIASFYGVDRSYVSHIIRRTRSSET